MEDSMGGGTVLFIRNNQTESCGRRWRRSLAAPGRDLHSARIRSGTVDSSVEIVLRRHYGRV